jgi:hypothetical protein
MSTTTNFKRIALVAIAALGLGVLSSVPSQAGVTGTITVSITNGTATTTTVDSSTAGTVKVRWLTTAVDSVSITASLDSKPTSGSSGTGITFVPQDTLTTVAASTLFPSSRTFTAQSGATKQDTAVVTSGGPGYVSGTFKAQLDTTSVKAGTYTFTVTVTPYGNGVTGADLTKVQTAQMSVVVTAPGSASTTPASTYSTAIIGTSASTVDSSTTTDASISAAAPASVTEAAVVFVRLLNAAGTGSTLTVDSLTVSIDKGNVSGTSGAPLGKNVIVNYAPSDATVGGVYVYVFPDGSTGTATLTIATKSAGTFTKTLTWFGTDYKSIVASSHQSVIGVGTSGSASRGIKGNAYDVNSVSYGASTTLYAYSSDTSVISDYGTLCGWDTTDKVSYCSLTGVKAGTANITLRDGATLALSTVASNAVSVRVSQGVLTSFTLTTDKSSYAPGEKGYLIVTAKDASGAVMPYKAGGSYSSKTFFDKAGITTTAALGNGSDSITVMTSDASGTFGNKFDRSSTPSSTDPIAVLVFYAPSTAGTLTFSAKGGTLMSAAQQATASTVTITVADSASAALAAVSALAVTVASLKTLITTLTNLVLKIQKKVKA